jgi:hypothetical protein
MRRSSKRLGEVLESYEQAAILREPRPGAPMAVPRLVPPRSDDAELAREADPAVHAAYLEGVAEQAAAYLEELRAGDRVTMHFEYHTLSPIDGGPRDIDVLDRLRELCRKDGFSFESEPVDDIGVHLTAASGAPPSPLRSVRPSW